MSGTPEVSHGRGGAGNITADDTKYVDGEIVRMGDEGSHKDGAFSTGRGGTGNICDTDLPPQARKDADIVPDAAKRPSQDTDRHVGRGGVANVALSGEQKKSTHISTTSKATGSSPPRSNADRLKYLLFGPFIKK